MSLMMMSVMPLLRRVSKTKRQDQEDTQSPNAKASCRRQFELMKKLDLKLDAITQALEEQDTDAAQHIVDQGKTIIAERIERIRIADRHGWDVLDAYIDDDVVDSEEKRKNCARELITTEERAHHACAKIHKPQRVRTRISPLSLHFHAVQFRSAGEKHAFSRMTNEPVHKTDGF